MSDSLGWPTRVASCRRGACAGMNLLASVSSITGTGRRATDRIPRSSTLIMANRCERLRSNQIARTLCMATRTGRDETAIVHDRTTRHKPEANIQAQISKPTVPSPPMPSCSGTAHFVLSRSGLNLQECSGAIGVKASSVFISATHPYYSHRLAAQPLRSPVQTAGSFLGLPCLVMPPILKSFHGLSPSFSLKKGDRLFLGEVRPVI